MALRAIANPKLGLKTYLKTLQTLVFNRGDVADFSYERGEARGARLPSFIAGLSNAIEGW
jgi:hypothetical protein